MYEEFYGLSRRPFENTPNPEFFFASKQHREGLAALIYGIKQSKGFMLVTGEVGSGKTFLIQSLKYELEEENHIILEVATPWITPEELFAELPEKLGMGMDAEWGSLVFQAKLKEELERLHAQGRRVLVILDEAQQLPERTLEGIRLLSNFENEEAKLIQIIFLGQNELNDLLGRYSMRQIRQRITLSRSLGYFNEIETRRYIEHRLAVSGCNKPIFNDDALSLIFRASHGSPRLINLICDNCLITGYAHFSRQIDAHVVHEVLADLPSVHQDGVSSYKQPVSADEQPFQATDSESIPEPAPTKRALVAEAKPTPAAVFESVVEPRTVRDPGQTVGESAAPQTVATSPFASAESYDGNDGQEYSSTERKHSGPLQRRMLWLVLVVTVVVSWYAARWYETRDSGIVAERKELQPANAVSVVQGEPGTDNAQQLSPANSERTWDDDPVMNSNPQAVANTALESSEQPAVEAPGASSAYSVELTSVRSDYQPEAPPHQAQSALERYSAGTKGDDGLSLFERLRREANVADVRTERLTIQPLSQQPADTVLLEVLPAAADHASIPLESSAVIGREEAEVVRSADMVEVGVNGRVQVGVPEGVITSSRRVQRYESGNAIPYPFANLERQQKQNVALPAGTTVSEVARAKYSTWNDTVQDMVRAVNPAIRNLDRVYEKVVNLPDVSRENLLVNDESHGWFAYTGTVTSRLKANHLYESFVALGEPADMEVNDNGKRRIYRVYIGPYDSRATALLKLGNIDLSHMPYLK